MIQAVFLRVKRLRSIKKIALLLLAVAMLMSCEKMSSLRNGVYLNGERVSNLTDGYAWGSGGSFSFQDDNACLRVYIFAEKAGSGQSIWDSDYLSLTLRPYHSDVYPWDEVGQSLSILRRGDGAKDEIRIYELPSQDVLEELTLVRSPSGLLEIKEKKGTLTGKARIDVSFVLSNGDEYQIVYRGEVDTNHATIDM